MKLFNFELTDWYRGIGGLYRYNIGYKENPKIAIALYHNLIEKEYYHPIGEKQLTENMVYCPDNRILWTVFFSHTDLNDLYYNIYEPTKTTEDEIKNNVDNFIIRVNKLIVFS